jgi:hypothetical protein
MSRESGEVDPTRVPPTQPVDLIAEGVPSGQYLRVEFTISSSNRRDTSVLQSFNVNYRCP